MGKNIYLELTYHHKGIYQKESNESDTLNAGMIENRVKPVKYEN